MSTFSTVVLRTKKPITDFAKARNALLAKTPGDWVFFVDTDEVVSPALKKEIEFVIQNSKYEGFLLKRSDYFLGRFLKFGETANVRLLRLARKNAGQWIGQVHEVWKINGAVGELNNPILHYPHPTISEFIAHINHYTDIRAKEISTFSLWQTLVFPPAKFFQNYFLRLGFLDGFPGFAMAFMMSLHSLIVRVKMYDFSAAS